MHLIKRHPGPRRLSGWSVGADDALLKSLPQFDFQSDAFFDELCHKFPLKPILSPKDNADALKMLGALGAALENEQTPDSVAASVVSYFQALSTLVQAYDATVYKSSSIKGVDVLKDLMELHKLNQYSFADGIGDQPVVSRILSGERQLTRGHIEYLSKRFRVSPEVFFDKE